jgi:hypothetical protein
MELSECWQSKEKLERKWDEARKMRMVAAKQALEMARTINQLSIQRDATIEEDEQSMPSMRSESSARSVGSFDDGTGGDRSWHCKVLRPQSLGTHLLQQTDVLTPHRGGISKRNAAQVSVQDNPKEHLGLKIRYTTSISRQTEERLLSKEEILGADITEVKRQGGSETESGILDGLIPKKNMRYIVSIVVLTKPSRPVSETGTSSLEVYQLSSFKDKKGRALSDKQHKIEAHRCLEEIQKISRKQAPLNRENFEEQGKKGKKLLVIVNPMSGHKMGKAIWDKVKVLLQKGHLIIEP